VCGAHPAPGPSTNARDGRTGRVHTYTSWCLRYAITRRCDYDEGEAIDQFAPFRNRRHAVSSRGYTTVADEELSRRRVDRREGDR